MTLAADPSTGQSFVMDDVSWEFYERLLQEVGDRHIFVTYDRGRLELMSPSWKHERLGELTAMVVRIVAMEWRIRFVSGGSTTFRMREADAGLEPDHCFYIQHAGAVIGKDEIDLSADPPPDVAIEIEMSRRVADRIEVYRRLGVPEIWIEDGRRLRVLHLGASGYVPAERSLALPRLLTEEVHALVESSRSVDEGSWIHSIQEWARRHPPAG